MDCRMPVPKGRPSTEKGKNKEKHSPGVRVRLSEKHQSGTENFPETDTASGNEGHEQKRIDLLA